MHSFFLCVCELVDTLVDKSHETKTVINIFEAMCSMRSKYVVCRLLGTILGILAEIIAEEEQHPSTAGSVSSNQTQREEVERREG